MKASGYGSIVNISSMSSINSSPDMRAYASSKAAINHMTANLAFDFAPEVRINAVAPGAIETQALASVLTPEIKERMLARTPLKRLGKAEDIAGAVLFLAAPFRPGLPDRCFSSTAAVNKPWIKHRIEI